MTSPRRCLSLILLSIMLLACIPPVAAQILQPIRNKLVAGDLLSAESILEVHRQRNGEDAPYLEGLSWLARGAALLRDWEKAARYAKDVRTRCETKAAAGTNPAKDDTFAAAWGAGIEVEAQALAETKHKKESVRFLEAQLKREGLPVGMRSRIYKRLNLVSFEGEHAPELTAEDSLGSPVTLGSLRGEPVIVFIWAHWCGDSRAQVAALAKVLAQRGVRKPKLVALTRYYEDDRTAERKKLEQVWKDSYKDLGESAVIVSTASMERYGGSSTPTLVFIDGGGKVKGYVPSRLTESELQQMIERITR